MTRVTYTGRNQDTPRYMPVTEREYIMPMQPYRGAAQTFSRVVVKGALVGAVILLVVLIVPIVAGVFA